MDDESFVAGFAAGAIITFMLCLVNLDVRVTTQMSDFAVAQCQPHDGLRYFTVDTGVPITTPGKHSDAVAHCRNGIEVDFSQLINQTAKVEKP